MYLRCAVHESPQKWKMWLPLAELWYNSSFHTALGCSPFKALYAYEPNLSLVPKSVQATSQEVQSVIEDRDIHLQTLKHHLLRAQAKMKFQADKKRSDLQFHPGQQVLLKLQPYVQTSVANRPYPKLAFKYYGPYTVLARVGQVAYKLQLPPDSLIHPVFHISQLKPFHPNYTPVYADLPKVKDLSVMNTVPEAILERRLVKKGNLAVPQVKVKWLHLPVDAATWEDYNVLRVRFPNALARGQASSSAGGDVRTTLT